MNAKTIEQVRRFNRFYTRILGLLNRNLLDSKYTLPEVRVLYEVHHHGKLTPKEITDLLDMDKGYLSRMLYRFEKSGLITREPSRGDGRSHRVVLTSKGERDFMELDHASNKQVEGFLSGLSPRETDELITHMAAIRQLLDTGENTERHNA